MKSLGYIPERILSKDQKEIVEAILDASLQAVDPYQAVDRMMSRQGSELSIGGKSYDLAEFDRVRVISIGKAAERMAQAAADIIADELDEGIVIQKMDYSQSSTNMEDKFNLMRGDHPVPGDLSLQAGQAVLEFLNGSDKQDLVIFLISGGGSALVTAPKGSVTLDDLQSITRSLLASGANIEEINTIRKHIDKVKGGGLAKTASRATKVTLILSDVVGNPLDMIASGPTVADPTTYQQAKKILVKYELWKSIPTSIANALESGLTGELSETPKFGDDCFGKSYILLVGSNEQAADAGRQTAEMNGLNAQVLTNALQGDAFEVGRTWGGKLKEAINTGVPVQRPFCLIAGGETTVVLQGDGLGGRNLEIALGAVRELASLGNVAFIPLATDGEDGPTDAAGAIVTGDTFKQAKKMALSVEEYHSNSDSYHYFQQLGSLIKTGSTGTNVNDLLFLFAF